MNKQEGRRKISGKGYKKSLQITEADKFSSTPMRWRKKVWSVTCPASGRRYYDNHNVARIMQIEKLNAMGPARRRSPATFASGGEVTDRLSCWRNGSGSFLGVEEPRLRAGGSGGAFHPASMPCLP